MALCPLAIASSADQTKGTGSFYFALSGSGGGGGPIVDQSFVATGTGTPPNGGFFQAIAQDFTGTGSAAFAMTDINGVPRWTIGTNGIELGTNTGDNFALSAYSDSGAFLTAPLTINRASGGVQMQNGLTVGNSLISTGPFVAASTALFDDLSGANMDISGSLLVGGVPVLLSQTAFVVNASYGPNTDPILPGIATTNIQSFTVPKTGLYILTADAQVGIDAINGAVVGPSDSISLNVDADMTVALKPYVMSNQTVNPNALGYQLTGCSIAILTAATPYQMKISTLNPSSTMAFPGGLSVQMKLVALC